MFLGLESVRTRFVSSCLFRLWNDQQDFQLCYLAVVRPGSELPLLERGQYELLSCISHIGRKYYREFLEVA